MKLFSVLLAGLVLTGCATTKPEMTEATYTSIAKAAVSLDYCTHQGWVSPEVSAKGKRLIITNANKYAFDTATFELAYQKENQNNNRLTSGECNVWASQILVNSANSAPVNNYNDQQDYISSTKSNQTYCNRIGTQTFCTTY